MSAGLRTFLSWITFQMGSIGGAAVLKPEWYSSGAYATAADLLPIQAWGALMVTVALLAGTARLYNDRRREVVVVMMALYTMIQATFAYSIFSLTWQGAQGAFAGSVMWIGYAWFAWRNLQAGVKT